MAYDDDDFFPLCNFFAKELLKGCGWLTHPHKLMMMMMMVMMMRMMMMMMMFAFLFLV